MQINFHIDGLIISKNEEAEMEEKIKNLEKYVKEPAVADIYIKDESGRLRNTGSDKKIKISILMGKEKIFIEELDANHMEAFIKAYHRIKTNLEKHHSKKTKN